jgi:beta-glucosidase
MKKLIFAFFLTIASSFIFGQTVGDTIFKNPKYPIDVRTHDLMKRLTIEEKIGLLSYRSPAIPRLGIVEYDWWNEALHGVARSGRSTVFPQAIGLAATFDDNLINRIATAISDEARAKFNVAQKIGNRGRYAGLTFWAPNVNIFRDPRWGRGQETYGEDPYLTSRMGVAFVKGMQGDDPNYLKVAACAKHYAVHSGPESQRHTFNALPSRKDLFETYLPAFKALVQDANVEAVMCAYNRTNDEPCCGNKYLLQEILRGQFGFKGHIVSDCWAITDFYKGHKTSINSVEAASLALESGVDLSCGPEFQDNLKRGLDQKLITENTIDSALVTLLRTRFKLGLFDPAGSTPWDNLSPDVICSKKHVTLAREAAQKGCVLLKNSKNALPLKSDIKSLYIIGPSAASIEVLLGNYNGVSNRHVTILDGITSQISPGTSVNYRIGCLPDRATDIKNNYAIAEASSAAACVAVMGVSPLFEGEEIEALYNPMGDRLDLGIPAHQLEFLKELRRKSNKPLILVLTGGSPICTPELYDLADAIIFAWYPGQEGGNGVADVLFGKVSPSGKLPITFPKSTSQLPSFEDYSMANRTYRYATEEPWMPFGFGLSYTNFEYSNIKVSSKRINKNKPFIIEATLKNVGSVASDEVVQLYVSQLKSNYKQPVYSMKGFKRVTLDKNEGTKVSFEITPEMYMGFDDDGKQIFEPGAYKFYIGGSTPSARSLKLGAAKPVEIVVNISEK